MQLETTLIHLHWDCMSGGGGVVSILIVHQFATVQKFTRFTR